MADGVARKYLIVDAATSATATARAEGFDAFTERHHFNFAQPVALSVGGDPLRALPAHSSRSAEKTDTDYR